MQVRTRKREIRHFRAIRFVNNALLVQYRGGKSRDLLIQLPMQVSENVIVWTPLLDVIGADGSVL